MVAYSEKWSEVHFRCGLKLWLPCEILVWILSHQLDVMWSPSPRPLSLDVPLPAFREQDRKWNVERRAWLCSSSTLAQRGLLKISMWGFKETGVGWWVMRWDLGPIWCGFVYSGPSKSHCSTFQVFHMSQSCALPLLLLPQAGCSAPANCLLLRVTGVIGYQFTEHISSIWL